MRILCGPFAELSRVTGEILQVDCRRAGCPLLASPAAALLEDQEREGECVFGRLEKAADAKAEE